MATNPVQEKIRLDLSQTVAERERTDSRKVTEPKDLRRPEEKEKVLEEIKKHLGSRIDAKLKLEIDKDLNRVVVKILDAETDEVIRQVPLQELLEIAKSLKRMEGVFFREEV